MPDSELDWMTVEEATERYAVAPEELAADILAGDLPSKDSGAADNGLLVLASRVGAKYPLRTRSDRDWMRMVRPAFVGLGILVGIVVGLVALYDWVSAPSDTERIKDSRMFDAAVAYAWDRVATV